MCQHVKETDTSVLGSPKRKYVGDLGTVQVRVECLEQRRLRWRNRLIFPVRHVEILSEIVCADMIGRSESDPI